MYNIEPDCKNRPILKTLSVPDDDDPSLKLLVYLMMMTHP